MTNSSFLVNWSLDNPLRPSYSSFGGCKGESAEVGKYAGAGGTLSLLWFGIFDSHRVGLDGDTDTEPKVPR